MLTALWGSGPMLDPSEHVPVSVCLMSSFDPGVIPTFLLQDNSQHTVTVFLIRDSLLKLHELRFEACHHRGLIRSITLIRTASLDPISSHLSAAAAAANDSAVTTRLGQIMTKFKTELPPSVNPLRRNINNAPPLRTIDGDGTREESVCFSLH